MTAGARFSNGYGLLIGVGADLPVTELDAEALHTIFVNPARAAYPPEQVQLLKGPAATRDGILQAFDTLCEQVRGNAEATVIVYFSGHGVRVEKPNQIVEYFLVPYGYQAYQRASTAITGEEFTARLLALKAQKLIVLLDCCHANGLPSSKASGEGIEKAAPLPPDLQQKLGTGSGRVIITSSHENEKSYTGTPYSIFTACLLEALEGRAAREKDGFARILDVANYLFAQVPKRAAGPQHPYVNRIEHLSENFALCYYAGGSKDVPGESPLPSGRVISADAQRYAQEKIASLKQARAIYDTRLTRLRKVKALLSTEEVTRILHVDYEMEEIQAEIDTIDREMEGLERKLHG